MPTVTLTALAAAGRNPTDITLPTVGSQAGGTGGTGSGSGMAMMPGAGPATGSGVAAGALTLAAGTGGNGSSAGTNAAGPAGPASMARSTAASNSSGTTYAASSSPAGTAAVAGGAGGTMQAQEEPPPPPTKGSNLTPAPLGADAKMPPGYIEAPNGDWLPPGQLWYPASAEVRRTWGISRIQVMPPAPEAVVRGANMAGAAVGLVGNGVEATAAVGLALTPEPTFGTKVAAAGLGALAIDGAQANFRTLVSLGQPTPTLLSQGVAGVAGYATDESNARVIGGVVDAGAHMGATAYAAYKIPTVAPGATTPGSAGKIVDNAGEYLGGTAYNPDKLKALSGYLERRGVALKVGDEFLPPGSRGGFVAKADGTAELILPSNPTEYQVWHELGHYAQWKELGSDAYRALPRWSPSNPIQDVPEQFVFDLLENSKVRRWDQLTFEEQQHAIEYVLSKGGMR